MSITPAMPSKSILVAPPWPFGATVEQAEDFVGPGEAEATGSAGRRLARGQPGRPLALAAAMFAATWAAIAIIAVSVRGRIAPDLTGMTELVTGLTAALALFLGTLDIVQWRLTRRTSHPWVGAAMILYGGVFLYGGQLFPIGSSSPAVLGYIAPASLLLLFGGMGLALTGRLHDQGLASTASWIRMGVSLAALTAALQFTPSLAKALALTAVSRPFISGAAAAQWTLTGLWLALAAIFIYVALRRTRRPADTAVAIVVLGLAQSRLALAIAPNPDAAQVLGSHVLQLVAFAVALAVIGSEFGRQVSTQQTQLLDSIVVIGADRARREARRTLQSAHAHDVRSALFAVDGAAQTLALSYDTLSPADRATLTGMLSTGVARLRGLVDARIEDIEPFSVDAVVHSVARAKHRAGVEVNVEVAPGLQAVGRVADLAAALQSLIDALSPSAGGAPLVLRGWPEDGFAHISVAGPDRLSPSATSVAVYVARRLIEEQGGSLQIEAGGSGQSEFVARLPMAAGEGA